MLFRSGTLNNHHMEVMAKVYPQMLQEMKEKMLQHMTSDNINKLSYKKKIAISKFLGQPIDRSLMQQSIQQSLNTSAIKNQKKNMNQPPQMQGKSTLGGMKELKVSNREQTETQQLEQKKP